jgi:hypothetical protein
VLAIKNTKALLISEEVLEKRSFYRGHMNITWEDCELREYLNGEFLDTLQEIKSAIAETLVDNTNNQWFGTVGGNKTNDRVFLLSLSELVKYFGDSGDLLNKRGKDYYGNVKSNGHCIHDRYDNVRIARDNGGRASWWWLRSPGESGRDAACVHYDGHVYVSGTNVGHTAGIRPALWLNL